MIALLSALALNIQSNDTLYLETYLSIIQENHPLIKKANIYDNFSEAYKRKGRGVFDPKISSSYERKFFEDSEYFSIWQSQVDIPTRLPVDFSVGYENNDGSYLNPEYNVPDQGLVYGKLSVSLIRGLLFDEQRYNLQKAELDSSRSQIEKDILTREIIISAIKTYLNWSVSHYEYELYEENFELLNQRHQAVLELYTNGDIPAIDTTESRMNLTSASREVLESASKLVDKKQKLSLFIWDQNMQPLSILESVTPVRLDELIEELESISQSREPVFIQDPKIRKYRNSMQALDLKRRLLKEDLKPRLDVNYNSLVNLGNEASSSSLLSANNYKYGINIGIPILNRKTRAEIQLFEAQLDQLNYDVTQNTEQLSNYYHSLMLNLDLQNDAIEFSKDNIDFAKDLYNAENFKFNMGESSIFMLNQRQNSVVKAQIELIIANGRLGYTLNELFYLLLGQNGLE